jgi:hypothetical protein
MKFYSLALKSTALAVLVSFSSFAMETDIEMGGIAPSTPRSYAAYWVALGVALTSSSLGGLWYAHEPLLLKDNFDDGDIETNTGSGAVGSGFRSFNFMGPGQVSEAQGLATISGSGIVKEIQSKDAFDPTNTTSTWVITQTDQRWAQGVSIGWAWAGKQFCCEATAILEVAGSRITFDLQAKDKTTGHQPNGRYLEISNGSKTANAVFKGNKASALQPITAKLFLGESEWRVDVTGADIDVHQKGNYQQCKSPINGKCISLNDVLDFVSKNSDEGRTMRPTAAVFREGILGAIDSVEVRRTR